MAKQELTELQMLLMDQQRAIENLSEQLIIQMEKTAAMEKKIQLLESRIIQFTESGGNSFSNFEKPPHY